MRYSWFNIFIMLFINIAVLKAETYILEVPIPINYTTNFSFTGGDLGVKSSSWLYTRNGSYSINFTTSWFVLYKYQVSDNNISWFESTALEWHPNDLPTPNNSIQIESNGNTWILKNTFDSRKKITFKLTVLGGSPGTFITLSGCGFNASGSVSNGINSTVLISTVYFENDQSGIVDFCVNSLLWGHSPEINTASLSSGDTISYSINLGILPPNNGIENEIDPDNPPTSQEPEPIDVPVHEDPQTEPETDPEETYTPTEQNTSPEIVHPSVTGNEIVDAINTSGIHVALSPANVGDGVKTGEGYDLLKNDLKDFMGNIKSITSSILSIKNAILNIYIPAVTEISYSIPIAFDLPVINFKFTGSISWEWAKDWLSKWKQIFPYLCYLYVLFHMFKMFRYLTGGKA